MRRLLKFGEVGEQICVGDVAEDDTNEGSFGDLFVGVLAEMEKQFSLTGLDTR